MSSTAAAALMTALTTPMRTVTTDGRSSPESHLHLASGLGRPAVVPLIDINPLSWLGNQAKESLADGFSSMMMGLWSAAMWLLQTAFSFIDSFTPNVADPNLGPLYGTTLWIGLILALAVALGQVALAVIRQDGRGLGTLLAGVVQYGLTVTGWVTVCAAVITGTSGLTEAILKSLLGVDSFSGYAAGDGFVDSVSGTVQATTLGLCAVFIVIPAAFGHLVIMMVRSAALLILTATMPIAAAGPFAEGTKAWMWKSIRWFLACALMEPLLALILGLGTQFAWAGAPHAGSSDRSSTAQNIGLSVVGSVILLVACFTPLALFRLLAFVDPGTASGASFRATMNANGGVSGLLRPSHTTTGDTQTGAGSEAATQTASDGRTAAENGAEAQTTSRFQSAGGSRAARLVPAVGRGLSGAMNAAASVAHTGASMSVDVLGQGGIGSQGYYDLSQHPTQAAAQQKQHHRTHTPTPQPEPEPQPGVGHQGVANDPAPPAGAAGGAATADGVFLI